MSLNPIETGFTLQENVLLARFTTLGIGGTARYFVHAVTEHQVVEAHQYALDRKLGLFVLGGGSNILVSDRGFDGLVLQIALKGILSEPSAVATGSQDKEKARQGERETRRNRSEPPASAGGFLPNIEGRPTGSNNDLSTIEITAGAGEDWDQFVEYCVDQNFAGVECLSGIPGFVGGTPVQNVGAYGQEVSETITSVGCFDRKTREIVTLSNSECGFSYRKSIFNSSERDRFIVLAVTFDLIKGGNPKLVYKDLKEFFDGREPSLREMRDAVLQIRRSKSMVIEAGDPNSRSAGSFFKNPIVPAGKIDEIKQSLGFEAVPYFPAGENLVKIPAAWLIEQSGFYKGFRMGNAGISMKHSLAIVNLGDATAKEIVELKEKIQSEVHAKFGIELQPEPIFVGF